MRKITSKLRGGLGLFYLSALEFIQGKTQKTLVDALVLNPYIHIRQDLRKLKVVHRISEVFEGIVKGQERDEKLWRLLQEVFDSLNREECDEDHLRFVGHYFIWNLLSLAGYKPEVHEIQRRFPERAEMIKLFLEKDIEHAEGKLRSYSRASWGILRKLAQEHLSRVTENC